MSSMSLSTLGSRHAEMDVQTEATQPRQTSLRSDPDRSEKDAEAAFVATHAPSTGEKTDITRTVTAQDWNGPDDPENPMNWSMWSRVYHTSVPALLGFLVTLGSSIYTPGVADMMEQFGVSSTVALLGLAVYLVGLACGPVLAAPLSETLGRKAVYITSLPLLAAFTLGAGFSQNFATLVICRFFAGFFGSPTLAVGAGSNADLWPPVDRAVATVLFILAPFAGPALGPTIGGYAVQANGWRWTQWPILFAAGPAFLYSMFMKETYKKIILKNRAKRLGIPPPAKTGPTGFAAVRVMLVVLLIRPVSMMFTEPIVGFFSLYIAFNFSVLFGFFDAFPIVFEGVYGFDLGSAGLPWIAVLVGCLLAVITVILIDRVTFRKHHHRSHMEGRGGIVPPEHRLYAAMIGSLGLPVGLFWFAWTSRSDIHWISPVLAVVPFAWGNLCVFASAALYLVDTYGPMTGASAMAANGLARYLSGAAFPLFTIQMYNRLGIAWATSLLGFISLGLLPIPWVLFKYGPRIRAKSNYETIKA
ncbi:hypothetical protein MMC32_001527 [Xylographa parallela]|nr:hypothetical protein [Xylographa parallela]